MRKLLLAFALAVVLVAGAVLPAGAVAVPASPASPAVPSYIECSLTFHQVVSQSGFNGDGNNWALNAQVDAYRDTHDGAYCGPARAITTVKFLGGYQCVYAYASLYGYSPYGQGSVCGSGGQTASVYSNWFSDFNNPIEADAFSSSGVCTSLCKTFWHY